MTQLAAIETLVIEPTLTGEHGRNRGLGRRQITANDDRSARVDESLTSKSRR